MKKVQLTLPGKVKVFKFKLKHRISHACIYPYECISHKIEESS